MRWSTIPISISGYSVNKKIYTTAILPAIQKEDSIDNDKTFMSIPIAFQLCTNELYVLQYQNFKLY
ncbi:MAG: hypothetical protein L3V56_13145 [Candidatus Magnetoovum sp. WYHC-5]|nr:hypothetical protein [Candidatus Magnetoovum sp. WYHC-5]